MMPQYYWFYTIICKYRKILRYVQEFMEVFSKTLSKLTLDVRYQWKL